MHPYMQRDGVRCHLTHASTNGPYVTNPNALAKNGELFSFNNYFDLFTGVEYIHQSDMHALRSPHTELHTMPASTRSEEHTTSKALKTAKNAPTVALGPI